MKTYLEIVKKTLNEGVLVKNRTDTPAHTLLAALFEHDMATGFPLLTTKKMPLSVIATELEFFIKGYTDKKWLQDRNCFIWDEWCNPQEVAHLTDKAERLKHQKEARDLGPIYGKQWRAFAPSYDPSNPPKETKSIDQLQNLLDTLKTDPSSRRMIVSAWNPLVLDSMALPPCHVLFQVSVIEDKLSLTWYQRSCDLMLGIPFNIASYALLLHLLAKASGYKEGKLIGMFSNVHIYENHMDAAREQLTRSPEKLPSIRTSEFPSLFDWEYKKHTTLHDYKSHPKIKFEVAV